MKIVRYSSGNGRKTVEEFFRRPAFDPTAEKIAAGVLARVRKGGNRAVADCANRFDGAGVRPSGLAVSRKEVKDAAAAVDARFRAAVREAYKRISRFAAAGLKRDWSMRTPRGGMLGEKFVPLDRVGVYIPGGAAPLASTALMTATLARVAGVREIVACTPCGRGGKVNPFVLHALDVAGATEIYRVGGIQAIGLMAYGTETVAKVQKIVGPGGTFVTAAKRLVYGQVALDLVAGPSEIAVLADGKADPAFVAADLLSQAEHGSGWEKALLVTDSSRLADAVANEIERQLGTLSRGAAIRRMMGRGMLAIVVGSIGEGLELCNRFAPEHFEIMTKNARKLLGRTRCAGAVFLGEWTPEPAGDFVAGPSHVLPTGGSAAMFSGLTVDDFRRRSSFMEFTRADLKETLPVIETFGRVEGLDAHARSASIRFKRQ